ncbi:MAG: hypothetical protein FJX76_16625 [Armatimonadetes bacterium]|nr:hypothetical protein [Armatimonadota bacterium]
MIRDLDLATLHLSAGTHNSIEEGACLLEAVSHVAGEPWSANPKCVSDVLTIFGTSLNDALGDALRQQLRFYIPRLIGTRTTAADEKKRSWLARDSLFRVITPAWLELAGPTAEAAALRALPELTTRKDVSAALPVIKRAEAAALALAASRNTYAAFVTAGAQESPRNAPAYRAARDYAETSACFAASRAAAILGDFSFHTAYVAARLGATLPYKHADGRVNNAAYVSVYSATYAAALRAVRSALDDLAAAYAHNVSANTAHSAARVKAAQVHTDEVAHEAASAAISQTAATVQGAVFDLFDRMIEVGRGRSRRARTRRARPQADCLLPPGGER